MSAPLAEARTPRPASAAAVVTRWTVRKGAAALAPSSPLGAWARRSRHRSLCPVRASREW
ncbi:hypothetical protein V493_00787, partial [Pseudogymnoascus sp. VKM F-4281 (FW-2241)]